MDRQSTQAIHENGLKVSELKSTFEIPAQHVIAEIENERKSTSIAQNIYRENFFSSIMDQTKDYPAPEAILTITQCQEVIAFLTLKSFSLWQGKQKSKKTTALALAVASVLRGVDSIAHSMFKCCISGKVLFIDNEQGESYAARTMKLILKLADLETSPNLIYCDLRSFSPNERLKIIQAALECTTDIKLVVIDGLVDLLTDFMDAGEGHQCTTEILKLCSNYDIHIAGVLHQNKNDKNARAHIGTISSQKCEIEISTEVDPDDRVQSIVTCVNSRGIPFEPFAIRWDKGSLPCINENWSNGNQGGADAKTAKNYDRSKELAEAIFKPLTALSHSDAITSIMTASMKSESTAKRLFKDLTLWGIVIKGVDGNYRINTNEGARVHEGSNRVHEPVH